MPLLLLCISIAVLFPFPVLYPPIASFTAYFFAKEDRLDAVSLFLLYSSAIVTSLIAATITPVADTVVYIESFASIRYFDFRTLALDNDGLEPLYKVYEFILSLFIGDDPNIFLLITALVINFLATTAILRIGIRLKQYRLPCLILAVCYSLVAPALGVPIFLLRSSLSLAILFLAISFYDEVPILFYSLGVISVFIHLGSILVFGLIIFYKYWAVLGNQVAIVSRKLFYASISGSLFSKVFLISLVLIFFVTLVSPNITSPFLKIFLSDFGSSGAVAANKAKSFLDAEAENFVDFKNPVVVIQIALTLLCFLKLQDKYSSTNNYSSTSNTTNLLDSLRLVGRFLIAIIVFTAPLNVLPYRLGFFNFMYFPLWLINVPFTTFAQHSKNYSKYVVLFALMSVLAYSLYWIPKREAGQYFIIVLENRPLKFNLLQIVGYFF